MSSWGQLVVRCRIWLSDKQSVDNVSAIAEVV